MSTSSQPIINEGEMIEDGSAQMGVENLGVIERRLLQWAVVGAQHAAKIPVIDSLSFGFRDRPLPCVVKSKINVGDGRMSSLLKSWKRCG